MDKNSPTDLDRVFTQIIEPPLVVRLLRQSIDTFKSLFKEPGDFLRHSLLPGRSWFPGRLAGAVTNAAKSVSAHPVRFVAGAFTPDNIGLKRRRRFMTWLTISIVLHSLVITALFVAAYLSLFWGVHVVERPYTKYNIDLLLAPLHYPPGMLKAPVSDKTIPLDELRKRDAERKKKEEQARLEREKKRKEEEAARKAEEARKEQEAKDEQARKEQQAKNEQAKPPAAGFGEINVTPIKDIVRELYQMYESGQLDLRDNYTIMASFKILPDGSIPFTSIKILTSSNNKIVDRKAMEVLLALGATHALGPLSSLSSNTIELKVTDAATKLSITSFAQTPEDAKAKAFFLNVALGQVKKKEKDRNPIVAELLEHLVLKADNKRIDADMTVPRARASTMMQNEFSKNSNNPR